MNARSRRPTNGPLAAAARRLRPWLGLLASTAVLGAWLAWGAASSDGSKHHGAVPTVRCGKPGKLELRRVEDGSTQLLCSRRLLVRVHVPW